MQSSFDEVVSAIKFSRPILNTKSLGQYFLLLSIILGGTFTGCSSGGGGGDDNGQLAFSFVAENPNLNVMVQQIRILNDFPPEIEFILYDDDGNTIVLDEIVHVEFVLSVLERTSVGTPFEYLSYSVELEDPDGVPDSGDESVQATYDPAGLSGLTQDGDGVFTFEFETSLPSDYDRSATHQLGAEIVRYSETDQELYTANFVLPFRPDGLAVSAVRELVSQVACNSCHTQLLAHDGLDTKVQLCILCHNSQSTDAETGNSLHFASLIHKIHQASDLPSLLIDDEPYQIHGAGNELIDYSTIRYPQDVRNCNSCHVESSQAHFYETAPTMQGCQSCHDRVWYGPVENKPPSYTLHPGGEHENNSQCMLCHSPFGNGTAPVGIVHTLPTESADSPGLSLTITDVDTSPGINGSNVMINFIARDKNNSPITDLSMIERVSATIAWPVVEHEQTIHELISSIVDPSEGNLVTHGDGSYSYTFLAELPITSDNTFAVSLEGRLTFRHQGTNHTLGATKRFPIVFSTDNSIPSTRRSIVLDQKCNVCHSELRAHDELRVGVDNCVLCHNPNATDESSRLAERLPPESINFKELIHRIHRGTELEHAYSIFDADSVEHDYTKTRFSGDLRDCLMCHVEQSMNLPLPSEVLSTVITENDGNTLISESLPMSAACISCHSATSSIQHALLYTDLNAGTEGCATCHGEDSELSVTEAHEIVRFGIN